jgi:hypothetical protein
VKFFTFQLTAHIGLLKGTPNAVKSVWEPKEGGNVKSDKSRAGQAQIERREGENYYRSFRWKFFETSPVGNLSARRTADLSDDSQDSKTGKIDAAGLGHPAENKQHQKEKKF